VHRDIYNDILLEGIDQYFTEEKVGQIMRDDMPIEVVLKGTQDCEVVNNADVTTAPKTPHYSPTCSLGNRSNTMVATHNLSKFSFYQRIAAVIIGKTPLNCNQLGYFELKWNIRESSCLSIIWAHNLNM
jgi:hypothetical protein